MTDFKSLNLATPVHRALEKLGYTTPTPIQEKAIPDVLAGRDLMGIAQTGTGKTAAFSLPLLSHIANDLKDPPKRGTRALILAPTRELAAQIAVSVNGYGVSIPTLRTAVVFGGVPIARQIKKLVRGNDVLVATPGRLIDLIDRKDVRLNDVEFLILDEADQMMDMGFIHALRKIIPHLPKERQTLFFSATMNPKIKKLAAQFLTDPVHVSVTPPNSTADNVEQSMIFVNKSEKQDLLALTLLGQDINRALIFTRTKHGADRVVKRLARVGIEAIAIHGNKSQGQRTRALDAFREARIRFLVATDIAARGIDIEGISHVINFEVPNVPEQYVHRIGRTARAGREGQAIAFVDKEERAYLKDIQKLLKKTIPVMPLPEDFRKKASEVNKRPALPRPEKAEKNYHPKDDPRRKKFKKKRKKNIQSAKQDIESATITTDKNAKSEHKPKQKHKQDDRQTDKPRGKRPPHPNSQQGQKSSKRKPRKGKPADAKPHQNREQREKTGGESEHGKPNPHKPKAKPRSQNSQNKKKKSNWVKPERSGGKTFKRKARPKNRN